MNSQFIFPILLIAVMYIFFFLPQIKKQKKQKSYLAELKKGDRIVTTGGIHGKIVELKDLTVTVDTGGGQKLKINRAALSLDASILLENEEAAE
ncbi:MAG: preprotein translocase subunit YajC [Bacteroidia bacterium]|jgi:preprotein translocase subunit YajC|nr:preprotein translocase subunit YajC [Bacteroidota bacterium]|tara:strand:- start:906 stop:1187 length:282 start_codon:yes stop_codon:yes gene_type:complete